MKQTLIIVIVGVAVASIAGVVVGYNLADNQSENVPVAQPIQQQNIQSEPQEPCFDMDKLGDPTAQPMEKYWTAKQLLQSGLEPCP